MYNVTFPKLGLEFEVNPIAFSIGNFDIYWYGVIIATGMLLAMCYAYFNASRFGVDRGGLVDCAIVGIITAIIGARLYYVLFNWSYYSEDLSQIFNIKSGGLAIYGGIIGALLGGCITARIKKLKILPILDITMIGFLIGQGVGRWGNFTNQEAFGTPTDLLWGMSSANTGNIPVHPCFLYESVWCLLGVLVLHIYSKKCYKYSGQIFLLYLVWYGFERTIVEGLRTDSLYLPFKVFGLDVRVSQLLSIIVMLIGIIMLIYFNNKVKKSERNVENVIDN